MKQTRLNIVTKTEKYPIIIGSNLTTSVSRIFKSNSIDFDKCLIVVDKNVPKKFIHKPWELNDNNILKLDLDYPSPIVIHEKARLKALEAFKKI